MLAVLFSPLGYASGEPSCQSDELVCVFIVLGCQNWDFWFHRSHYELYCFHFFEFIPAGLSRHLQYVAWEVPFHAKPEGKT